MKVVIIGAGIGGLTLAIALVQAGIEPVVVERSDGFATAGAGILIQRNASACLVSLGLEAALDAHGHRLPGLEIGDESGRRLSGTDNVGQVVPTWTLHRGALHQVLQEGLDGVEVRFGVTPAGIVQDEDGVRVTLSDGSELVADVLVGADGIYSTVREQVFGDLGIRTVYSGYTCWRAVIEGHRERAMELWGPGQRMGLVPLVDGQLYIFLTDNAEAGTPGKPDPVSLVERFAAFAGAAGEELSHCDAATLLHHDIEYLSAHAWQRGRVALLGDAAHAFTPNMGQGAGMAIEDAVVLARCLAEKETVREALTRYEAARRKRVRWVSDTSQRIGVMGQLHNSALRWVRDTVTRLTPDAATKATLDTVLDGGPVSPST